MSDSEPLDIFSRNNQITGLFQLPQAQLITDRDGIRTCINSFILSITENTVCKIRQHSEMETSVCGMNTVIYSSTATTARYLANTD